MLKPTSHITIDAFQGVDVNIARELTNCFNYIAPVKLIKGQTDDTKLGLEVILRHHPYWLDSDEGSAETWGAVMAPWLAIKLRTLQNTIEAYDRKKGQKGEEIVPWKSLVLRMAPYTLEFGFDDGNRMPDVMALLEDVRSRLNAGENPFDENGYLLVC